MPKENRKEASKQRILSVCVRLFIEKGYHKTTLAEILSQSGTTSSTFQNIFRTKDGVLLDLTEFMFKRQFAAAAKMQQSGLSPVYLYAVETAIQLALAELNENLREIYVEAYSDERIAEYIFEQTAAVLTKIFGPYNPTFAESDFYESEIGTAGIMRNYMAKRCDKYFTFEKKLRCFLGMSLRAYNVPQEEIQATVDSVIKADIKAEAEKIMQSLFESLAEHFGFEQDINTIPKTTREDR